MESIKFKKLTKTATLPKRGSVEAAGYDLFADLSDQVEIAPHETMKISTGISMAVPKGYFGGIFARSGISVKKGLRPANCTGVIDSDYRGELIVALHNDTNMVQTIEPQERVAQLIVIPYLAFEIEEVQELDVTERGEGGFGSTGMK
ncbi:dUTP diphosphatase [Anaerosporobacter faecicola]|uniref:dUTP diphosphatase n=1 Tax=Anaerosporobacter faecicola TaxID=2718714 RepID=UPI00143A231E|nr:dUTP diphosphatase [Anaerosporobacter faecicola]